MQSTASLLSGGVIEILLATAYVSCLALYRTFPLPCRNFNLSATGAEKASRTDHQTQMQIHLCLSSQARVEAMLIKQKTFTETHLSIKARDFKT